MSEFGPYTFRCKLFGCRWGKWVGEFSDAIDVAGKKCERCGRWKYKDGSYLPGVENHE